MGGREISWDAMAGIQMRDSRHRHLLGGMNGPFSDPLGTFSINFVLALSLHLHPS